MRQRRPGRSVTYLGVGVRLVGWIIALGTHYCEGERRALFLAWLFYLLCGVRGHRLQRDDGGLLAVEGELGHLEH